ncbi:hypothetical protein TM49_10545 [Martelella endophytica]|uniref:Uncharacterized protein n=1 Tax=Martelella endophytica TaxID=1486262 RepID=A0A0D5LPG1_MAREN|nr:hypothetical protein TM49_10545 [Martelella endophytica]
MPRQGPGNPGFSRLTADRASRAASGARRRRAGGRHSRARDRRRRSPWRRRLPASARSANRARAPR